MDIDVQLAVVRGTTEAQGVPATRTLKAWVRAALADVRPNAQLTLRIVGVPESQQLNEQYRGKRGPTNVLSFPFEAPAGVKLPLLGDIVICAPVVMREAHEQGKAVDAHWCHIVIHGVLHLLGYDHIKDADARVMEEQEKSVLRALGYPDPYAEETLGAAGFA